MELLLDYLIKVERGSMKNSVINWICLCKIYFILFHFFSFLLHFLNELVNGTVKAPMMHFKVKTNLKSNDSSVFELFTTWWR